jgi:hypothetical protein
MWTNGNKDWDNIKKSLASTLSELESLKGNKSAAKNLNKSVKHILKESDAENPRANTRKATHLNNNTMLLSSIDGNLSECDKEWNSIACRIEELTEEFNNNYSYFDKESLLLKKANDGRLWPDQLERSFLFSQEIREVFQ